MLYFQLASSSSGAAGVKFGLRAASFTGDISYNTPIYWNEDLDSTGNMFVLQEIREKGEAITRDPRNAFDIIQ